MMKIPKFVVVVAMITALSGSLDAKERTTSVSKPQVYRTAYVPTMIASRPDSVLNDRELKVRHRQVHRDSVRAEKKVWTSILGGPSYTPDASFGVGGAMLMSFRTSKADTLSQRSFLPVGFNISVNGTMIFGGGGTLFFNENKFRIYTSYGYRNDPANFYGVGMDEIKNTTRGENTTAFDKRNIYINARFVWEVRPQLYVGPLFDVSDTKVSNLNPVMQQNAYVQRYAQRFTNIGLGGLVQYDTRDDVATPNAGLLLSATVKDFARYFGGSYNYQLIDLEYRQFQYLFGRSVLGWVARTQMTYGDVPYTELPSFGAPFDLRGFYLGEYRDKSMGYAMVEYRQMLGSQQDYAEGRPISKFGYVVWAGVGTLGETVADWNESRWNVGVGLRVQIQPRKNFRLDIGKGQGEKGMMVYLNMTEAF